MSNSLGPLILKQKRNDKLEDQLFMENHFKELLQHCFLFAGKLHAVLCRNFLMGETTYIKGRDYFDLDWYLTNGVQPNYTLLKNALYKAGPFENQELQFDNTWLKNELENKLKELDWDLAKSDMSNFLLERSLEDLNAIFDSDSMIKKTEVL